MSFLFANSTVAPIVSGQRVTWPVPDNSNYPIASTVTLWVRPGAAANNVHILFGTSNATHGLWLRPSAGTAPTVDAAFTTLGRWQDATGGIPLAQWTGLGITFNGAATTNAPLLYVRPEGGVTALRPLTVRLTPTGTFSPVVQDGWGTGSIATSFGFNGHIAYVRVFEAVLSAAEVDAELSAPTARRTANLFLDAPMDTTAHASASVATDYGPHAYHGTVVGAAFAPTVNPALGSAPPPTLGGGAYRRRAMRWVTHL
jgi:hypothetical protein